MKIANPAIPTPAAPQGSVFRAAVSPFDLLEQGGSSATTATPPVAPVVGAAASAAGGQTDAQLMGRAQQWVSQTFFGTLLKQMRDSPFKSDLFSGGRGGDAFGEMYDQHLADRMARASGRQLAESIVKHLQRRKTSGGPEQPKNADKPGASEASNSAPSVPNGKARSHVTAGRGA